MIDTSFRAVCEAAQADWDVPALAIGTSFDERVETLTLGCEPSTRFRIASVTAVSVSHDMTGGIVDRFRSLDVGRTAILF